MVVFRQFYKSDNCNFLIVFQRRTKSLLQKGSSLNGTHLELYLCHIKSLNRTGIPILFCVFLFPRVIDFI